MRCRVRQTRYHLSVAIVVGLSLLSTVGAETSSPEADCAEREVKGGCLPRHRLHHLLHHHEYSGRNVNVVEHLALLHADQPGAETLDSQLNQTASEQTIAEYINNHVWAQTGSNKRLRRFLEDSSLLANTTVGSRPKLAEWYYTQTDVLLDQPASFLTEHDSGRWNHSKDIEWLDIHKNYTQQMADSQEVDFLLYGDSIFESTLGTSVGHKIKRAEQIPAVWNSYHSGSNKKVMAITADTTVDLMWRLLNGAMPITSNVKQVVLQIGANNLLKQWFQLPEEPMMRPAAVASSIISICILIRATWPETNLLVAGVLVGGVRGDWKGEPRSHKLPNRYSSAAAVINTRLMDWVQEHQDHQVSYVDCSGLYVIPDEQVPGGLTISEAIMNDTLHPNGFGFSMLLDDCFEQALRKDINPVMFPSVIWND